MNVLIWQKSISRITVIYLYINNISLFIVSPFCTCINFGKRGVGTFSCLMMIDFCCYNSLKSNFEVMCANIKRRLHTIFFIETFFSLDRLKKMNIVKTILKYLRCVWLIPKVLFARTRQELILSREGPRKGQNLFSYCWPA